MEYNGVTIYHKVIDTIMNPKDIEEEIAIENECYEELAHTLAICGINKLYEKALLS